MTPQTLPFAASVKSKGEAILADLELALRGRGWMSAKQLAKILHTDDRTIREAASQSEGRIISGQKGYAWSQDMPVHEVMHAAAWLRSQARVMEKRAYEIERAVHQRSA